MAAVRRARAAWTESGLALALLAAVSLQAIPITASAAGEKEWQTSVRLGAATINVDDRKPWGYAGALDVEYGLSDAWALRGTVSGSLHPVSATNRMDTRPTGTVRTTAALAGVTYTVDVLRLVPYADLQMGAIQIAGAVMSRQVQWAAELGAGADYFWTPQWLTGLSVQYLFEPSSLFSDPLNLGRSPFSFYITLRVSRVWF